jgi:tetratricopeptide (TPR) repeat protein
LIATDRVEEGIRLIEQTLTTDPSCASEPADMLSYLADAYLDTGRAQDAARAYRRAVAALAESDSDMVGARGRRIRLLARGGQATRAIRAIEEEQHLLTGGDSPYSRLVFSVLVGAATHVLRAEHADAPLRLTGVPAATIAELDDWLHAQAAELAAAFDARNGTAGEAESVARAWATVPAGVTLDLDVLPRGTGATPVAGTGAAASAPVAGPTGAAPSTDPAALIAEAERLSGAGDTESAATAYLHAATAAEAAGLLVESGFCYAEAAYCAQVLGDEDGAAGAYEAAVARLTAGGAEPATTAPVVVQWARAAAVAGGADRVLTTVATLVAALDAQQPDPEMAEDLAKKADAARRRTTADLQDAAARLLATRGDDAGAVEGARLAQQAAEAYGGLGVLADAAHAFWIAGRLHDRLGQVDEAVWNLESAMEGFALSRQCDQRGEVANLLIDVLRRSGQVARAEALAAELTS